MIRRAYVVKWKLARIGWPMWMLRSWRALLIAFTKSPHKVVGQRKHDIHTLGFLRAEDNPAGRSSKIGAGQGYGGAHPVDIIDKQAHLDFLKDRPPARAASVISIFVKELSDKAIQLESITQARDFKALEALAHSMIGSAALLGACRLAVLCRSIEKNCIGGREFETDLIELLLTIQATVKAYSITEK